MGLRGLAARVSAGPPGSAGARAVALLRCGAPAALRAALGGLLVLAVPVLLVWFADSRAGTGVGAAIRTSGQIWLMGNGDALHVPAGEIGLAPLGLLAVVGALLARAGRRAVVHLEAAGRAVTTLADAARLTAAVALPYALGVAAVALLARGGGVRPDVLRALCGGALLAATCAGAGVLRRAGLVPTLTTMLPSRVRRVLSGGAAAVAAVLAGGAVLSTASLLWHFGRAVDLASAPDPGVVGGAGLLLVGVLLAPNAAVWGACYLSGPGFAVGTHTAVGPFAAHVGALPAIPVLAGLPSVGAPAWAPLLLAVPVGAGALAGRLLHRRGGGLVDAALAGPAAGLLMAVVATLSGGPLGGRRLAAVGPSGWQVGLALAVEVAAGALAAVLLLGRPAVKSRLRRLRGATHS